MIVKKVGSLTVVNRRGSVVPRGAGPDNKLPFMMPGTIRCLVVEKFPGGCPNACQFFFNINAARLPLKVLCIGDFGDRFCACSSGLDHRWSLVNPSRTLPSVSARFQDIVQFVTVFLQSP
jgi:hypothetical protein